MNQKADKKTTMILFGKPVWRGMLTLSLPVVLVNILKTLHDLVDGLFLGQVPDANGISVSTQMQSAVGLTWPVFFVFISLGMGLTVAGNALIGQHVGKGDYEGARKYASNTVFLAFVLGVIFNILLYLFAPAILTFMQAKDAIFSYALTYLRIRSFELPFLFLSYGYQAVRQATGDTSTPVIVNSISILINVILTPILIVNYQMGVAGAALSTLIAHVIITPLMLYFFLKPKNGLKVIFKKEILDGSIMKHISQIAIPASTGQAIQAVGFVIMNSMVLGFFGEAVSAAFYIGNRINSLVMMPVSSISSILAIYIAQNVGAGNVKRAKLSFRSGMFMAVSLMAIGSLLIIPFRSTLVQLFNSNPITVMYAAEYTLWLHLGLPLMGVFQTFLSTFQGSGETKYSFIMAVIRLWAVRLPLILIAYFFTGLGPAGVWYSILLSNIIMVPIGMYLYAKVRFLPKIRTNSMKNKQLLV